ncbi:HAD-IA family hydrolase [Alteromonas sp. ASW11-19]|uniref:HAD-IA family hydrolase n=1 Tax=Alteromonas salexigens TaxID=2982530 RepID=A0ABT2VQK6_9ALTE|nr:HAD-IA family hydrolase [Alteromonas salexigens]MCU7554728.1 HAD-IA family hydrolase [Alteromonas salexigens]
MRFYRPLGPIRAITFDLDDTLYDNGPVIRQAEQALTAFIGTHYPRAAALSAEDWHNIRHTLISETPALASDMGELRLRTLTQALQNDVSGEALTQAASACFDCFYHARSELTLADDVHRTLDYLAQRVPLVGITNGNVDPKRIGIDSYFDTIFHASLTRPMKPARPLFDDAATHIDQPPAQILHVGDNLIKDVHGAINAGYQTAWFACNRPMQLPAERVSTLPHVQLDCLTELMQLL